LLSVILFISLVFYVFPGLFR